MSAVVLDALDLAALLCSRVCHDLISPTGAIVNGLEVLEEKDSDEETKTFALDLIKRSARTASVRLQFCRLAFGAAGSSSAQVDLGDARTMAQAFIEDDKTKLAWNLPRVLLPKNRVKLLLNLLIIAGQAIPRGGTLAVDPVGAGESMASASPRPASAPVFRKPCRRCSRASPRPDPSTPMRSSRSMPACSLAPAGSRSTSRPRAPWSSSPPVDAPALVARLRAQELVLEPAPHGRAAQCEIVALAVLRAAFLAREHAQRLVFRPAGIVEPLRIAQRNLLVVFAVHHQERAAHFLHDAVELERLEPLQCVLERRGAQDPHDVVARDRQRCLELGLDAPLPHRVIIPDGAPGDAGGKARLERGTARRVVAAEADRDDADLPAVDVTSLFQEIDASAAGFFIIVAQDKPAETDGLAGAGADQDRDAALDQLRHAGEVLDLLGDVEAVKEYDARRARRFRILGMNEIAWQAFAFERHLDDVDLDVRERREAVEAIDRGAVGSERRFVLRGAKAFAHLIVVTSAQIEGRGRDRMAGCGEAVGVAAHFVGDLDAGVEPGCVVLGVFARERPSDLVQLANVGAAVGCAAEHVDEGRRPSVVAGKVHEIFRHLGHRSFPPSQSHAGARPAGLAILPSGRLSAAIRSISSSVSAKSKTLRFSAMRLAFDERGIATMLPCWISQRSAIWASGRPLWAAISASTGSRNRRPRPSGQ